MHFEFSNLFSLVGVFIVAFAVIISYFIYREIKSKISYFFATLIIGIALFVVLKDERQTLISKLESSSSIKDLYMLAHIYQAEGNIPELIRVYMKIIERDPKDEQALLNLAVLLIHSGHQELGLQIAKRVISINPENKQAREIIELLMDSRKNQEGKHDKDNTSSKNVKPNADEK